jgi:hypothetical protein
VVWVPVDIADDGYGSVDMDDITFAHEDFLDEFAYCFEDFLAEEFSSFELCDAFVEI